LGTISAEAPPLKKPLDNERHHSAGMREDPPDFGKTQRGARIEQTSDRSGCVLAVFNDRLPTSMPAQRSITAAIMSRIPSAVESAIRAYAEIFLLGPAHHSGIPARESSQFRTRAHINNHSDRSLHDLHILKHFHSRGGPVTGHGVFRRGRVCLLR
jgi:hypothetical protein